MTGAALQPATEAAWMLSMVAPSLLANVPPIPIPDLTALGFPGLVISGIMADGPSGDYLSLFF